MKTLKQKIEEIIKSSKNLKGLPQSLKKHKLVEEVHERTSFLADKTKKISERVYCILNEINEQQKCICGKQRTFEDLTHGYKKTCGSTSCASIISRDDYKKTCLERYGVDNPSKTKEVQEKISKIFSSRTDKEIFKISEKRRETFFKKYGTYNNTSHAFDNHVFIVWEERQEKSVKRNLEKFGEEHWSQTENAKSILSNPENIVKRRKTCIEKYGVEFPYLVLDQKHNIVEKISKIV